jgi:hypothetical protein
MLPLAASASPPANTAPPIVSGSATTGSTLTATTGSWANSPSSFGYQWQRCAYAPTVLAHSPAAYWRLGDSSGATMSDSSPNGNTGTYRNGVVLGAPGGLSGNGDTAASFDGSDDYASVPNSASLNGAGTAITLEALVKPASGSVNLQKPILLKSYTSHDPPYYQYGLFLYPSASVIFGLSIGGAYVNLVANNTGWVAGQWSHFAATYDGSTMRIYVNGTQVASKAQTGAVNTYATPLDIGAYENLPKVSSYTLGGVIDEVAIYPSALSSAVVQADSAAALGTGPSCANISGATSATYSPSSADLGTKLRVTVSAANADGSSSANSTLTSVVGIPVAPTNSGAPQITGTASAGLTLSATVGDWQNGVSTYAYQWRRCDPSGNNCLAIPDANSTVYGLRSDDIGSKLRFTVTASNDGGTAAATSDATAVVAGFPPASETAAGFLKRPTISQPRGGQVATATFATTGGGSISATCKWQQAGSGPAPGTWTDIPGATACTTAVPAGDAKKWYRAWVTASNSSGVAASGTRGYRVDGEIVLASDRTSDCATTQWDLWLTHPQVDCSSSDPLQRRLTNTAEAETAPDISPDGTKVAYVASNGTCPCSIKVTDTSGTDVNTRTLVTGISASSATSIHPSWSPHGDELVYAAGATGERTTLNVVADPGPGGGLVTPQTIFSPSEYIQRTNPGSKSYQGVAMPVWGNNNAIYFIYGSSYFYVQCGTRWFYEEGTMDIAGGDPCLNMQLGSVQNAARDAQIAAINPDGTSLTVLTNWSTRRGAGCPAAAGAECAPWTGAADFSPGSGYTISIDETSQHVLYFAGVGVPNHTDMAWYSLPTTGLPDQELTFLPRFNNPINSIGSTTTPTYGPNGQILAGVTQSGQGRLAIWDENGNGPILFNASDPGNGNSTPSWASIADGAPVAPINVIIPKITGRFDVGMTLSASSGQWLGSTASLAYQWQQCQAESVNCADIMGATTPTYHLPASAAGTFIRVRVRATNAGGEATAASMVSPVILDELLLANLALDYRPALLFDSSEHYRPISVDSLLEEGVHQRCNFTITDRESCWPITGVAGLLPNTLPLSDVQQSYIRLWKSGDGDAGYRDPSCPSDSFRRDCSDAPTLYYDFGQSNLGYRFLDYWFFYRNNPFDTDHHEGDWEGVTVVLDPDVSAQPAVDGVIYWQHGKPTFRISQQRCVTAGGTFLDTNGLDTSATTCSYNTNSAHAAAFIASGSHASYDEPCDLFIIQCPNPAFPVYPAPAENDHRGDAPWGQNSDAACSASCVTPLMYIDGTPDLGWASWEGLWGADWTGSFVGNSPRSPGQQSPYKCTQLGWACDTVPDGSPLPTFAQRAGANAAVGSAANQPSALGRCLTWYDGGLAAFACSPSRLAAAVKDRRLHGTGSFRLVSPGRHSSTVPGLTQIMGGPFTMPATLKLLGKPARDQIIIVNVQSGKGSFRVTLRSIQMHRRTAALRIAIKGNLPAAIMSGFSADQKVERVR